MEGMEPVVVVSMEPVAVVTVLALIQYFWFGINVGRARVKSSVDAPAISGDDVFDRTFRVHQNTLEQLVLTIPGLWLFGWYVSPLWSAVVGLVYIVGRGLYSIDYVRDPKSRARGFMIGWLAQVVLLIGTLVGVGMQWFGGS